MCARTQREMCRGIGRKHVQHAATSAGTPRCIGAAPFGIGTGALFGIGTGPSFGIGTGAPFGISSGAHATYSQHIVTDDEELGSGNTTQDRHLDELGAMLTAIHHTPTATWRVTLTSWLANKHSIRPVLSLRSLFSCKAVSEALELLCPPAGVLGGPFPERTWCFGP